MAQWDWPVQIGDFRYDRRGSGFARYVGQGLELRLVKVSWRNWRIQVSGDNSFLEEILVREDNVDRIMAHVAAVAVGYTLPRWRRVGPIADLDRDAISEPGNIPTPANAQGEATAKPANHRSDRYGSGEYGLAAVDTNANG